MTTPSLSEYRQRLEWETRDTMNQRMLADTFATGAKVITPAMLAAHPTQGAWVMNPSASRQDQRPYNRAIQYFPGNRLPPKSLFANPAISRDGFDIEGGDVVRELRGVVQENNRFRTEEAGTRALARSFAHAWRHHHQSNDTVTGVLR